MPITRQVGWVQNTLSGSSIPIYGLENIEIGREQAWNLTPMGLAGGMTAVWEGAQPIEYNLNFELTVGWGQITDRAELFRMCKVFHAMGSQTEPSDYNQPGVSLAYAPPPCHLIIGGGDSTYIDQIGVFRNVKTVATPPWGGNTAGLAGALPTTVQFTGSFIFIPGYSGSSPSTKIGVDITLNTKQTAMKQVESKFYTLK